MGIPNAFDHVKWFGRGPLENYVDRRYGFDAAVYDANMVRLEKKAVYDSGLDSWMMWNASNKYTKEALDSE